MKKKICDYGGTCKNKAYREVYPMAMGGKYENKGWSYLCRKHFELEKKKFKGKLPYCSLDSFSPPIPRKIATIVNEARIEKYIKK